MTAQHFNGFTPLPPYPTPDMPDDTYNAAAYATTEAYPIMIAEITAAAAVVESNANLSEQQAGVSGAAATAAAKTLIDVQTAANGAFAAASYKGDWSTLTGALNVPATVTHLGRLWYLKLNLANVTSQAPALGSTYWGEVSRNDFTVLACPAGTTVAADRGMYRMSSGGSVLQLPAIPFHGMVVAAVNVSGTLTPYIQRNGKTICGDAEDYLMNQLGWQIMLQFDSATNDWVRINGVTAYTAAQPAIGSSNAWTAPQAFNAGASFGDGKVLLRKVVTVTAPAFSASVAAGSAANHGLTYSKIRSISIIAAGASFSAMPEYGTNTTLKYSAYLDATTCNVYLAANQGQDIAGRQVYFSIEYEA